MNLKNKCRLIAAASLLGVAALSSQPAQAEVMVFKDDIFSQELRLVTTG